MMIFKGYAENRQTFGLADSDCVSVSSHSAAAKNEHYTVDTHGLPEGEYAVKIKLYFPQASRRVLLGLSPAIMDADGFYRIGLINVEK